MTVTQSSISTTVGFFAARIGNAYDYGNMFSPTQIKDGTDCSGSADTLLRILTTGTGGPVDGNGRFIRTVTTESWPYNYPADLAVAAGTVGPYGTICAGDAQPGPAPTVYPPQIPSNAAAIIYLLHGGGGLDSHMMIAVNDGTGNYIVMETGGNHNDTGGDGQYASPNGPATSTTDPEWTDIWYLPGSSPPPAPPPVLTQQQVYAQQIIAAGEAMSITPLGCQMALCCGLDESGIRVLANSNVPASLAFPNDGVGSNGQSCGIFQQQAQFGWGTVACEMDATCSATLFYTALARLPYNSGGQTPWMYIQNVQGSATADGSNYEAQWNNAVALYNSVINIAPTPGGFLMALTDDQQTQLFNAICAPVASQSPFRALGEGTVWEPSSFWGNDDGFIHPQYVEWAATLGDPISLAVLNEIATADVTVYPDRIEDIRLAQDVLARVTAAAGGVVTPTPTPTPAPAPTPTPVPGPVPPTPAPAPGVTITTGQLIQWVKDALSILGAIGTWATAAHGVLGQYLPGTTGVVVPAALAVTTAGFSAHTVHQRKVAVRANTR